MIWSIVYLLAFMTIILTAMLIFDIIGTSVYKLYRKVRYIMYKNR